MALCCMAVIYYCSAQNGAQSDGMSVPIAQWLQKTFHLNLTQAAANHIVRKTAHFSIYFLLGVFVSGWSSGFHWKASVWVPVSTALCALYAASDEFHQSFVSMRCPSGLDVLLDTAGALVGSMMLLLLYYICRRFHSAEGGASMICPNCGYDNPDDVLCCVKCGESLVDSSTLFSPDGKEIDMSEPDVYEPYEEEKEAPHKSRAPAVVLTILLCLVAGAAGLSFAWHQECGVWPWEQLLAGKGASQVSAAQQSSPKSYTAADLAAVVHDSGFEAFEVSEAEISGIKTDVQTLPNAALVQFTVTKAMAVIHMQVRIPTLSASSAAETAVSSAATLDKPAVTAWSVDPWKLTGTWNDTAGNTLLIETCSGGSLSAYYIPAGTTDSRMISGSISETGYISLVSSKTQISGQFSPNGTGLLTVTMDGDKSQTQQFVMLSTAVANLPKTSSASGPSSDSSSSALPTESVPDETLTSSEAVSSQDD